MANIGTRPTVAGDLRHLLEVHLFDFAGDLYGRHAQVEFRLKLRDEQKFDSFLDLKAQIDRDAAAATGLLWGSGRHPEGPASLTGFRCGPMDANR